MQDMWVSDTRKSVVYVDSYDDGILSGWFMDGYQQVQRFFSLSQFLLKMEQMLDDMQMPQGYTLLRRYGPQRMELPEGLQQPGIAGTKATFELKVLFRQHTSWQGVLLWREKNREHSFRSVLELVSLMDSALQNAEGGMTA